MGLFRKVLACLSCDQVIQIRIHSGAWCNAWRNDNAWFLVTERMTAEDKDNQRRTSLWLLDIGERRWVKLPIDIETPERTSNFAFRVTPTGASFVHADWDRTAASFHRFELRSYTVMRLIIRRGD